MVSQVETVTKEGRVPLQTNLERRWHSQPMACSMPSKGALGHSLLSRRGPDVRCKSKDDYALPYGEASR